MTLKKIIVSSTQYPGYGGAATNSYEIIKYLKKNGYKVAGLFFNFDLNVNYNPDNIDGIFLYHRKYDKKLIYDDITNYFGAEPDLCLAKNYIAPINCKDIFNCYTIYLVSGINHFSLFYNNKSAQEILDDNFIIDKVNDREINCIKQSDLIVLNSEISHKIFMKIYKESICKINKNIIDTTQYINKINSTFDKEYDILICCSDLERPQKNNLFLIEVLKNNKFDKFNKIIIGEKFDKFKNIKNSHCIGLTNQTECIEYMAKSKLLLFPSLFDSNSNTIREAYYNKCLPLITENIGFYELYPNFLICKSFEVDEWSNKIINIFDNYESYKNVEINFNKDNKGLIDLIENI